MTKWKYTSNSSTMLCEQHTYLTGICFEDF